MCRCVYQYVFISYAQKFLLHVEMFVGLYDFNALEAGDLSFKESERLQVVDAITSKWWKARSLVTNMEGYIPSNYVAPVQSIQKQEYVAIHITLNLTCFKNFV